MKFFLNCIIVLLTITNLNATNNSGVNQMKTEQEILTELVEQNFTEIKTLDLNENSNAELHFLKDLIGAAKLVMLGEQNHGDGTTFLAKAKIIKYLHEEMGFNVLAYESDFYECNTPDFALKKTISELKQGLFRFWKEGKELQPFFEYLVEQNLTTNPIHLTGFDCQYMQSSDDFFTEYKNFCKVHKLSEILSAEQEKEFFSLLGDFFGKPYNFPFTEEYKSNLISHLTLINSILGASPETFFKQEMKNLLGNIEYRLSQKQFRTLNRDTMMADNLSWLKENPYKNEKIIVWAHDFHILKDFSALVSEEDIAENKAEGYDLNYMGNLMGERIYRKYQDEVYVIGFVAGGGEYSSKGVRGNYQVREKITNDPNSLEAFLHQKGIKYGFMNLPQDLEFMMSGDEHDAPVKANWNRVFDAIFYLDKMDGINK